MSTDYNLPPNRNTWLVKIHFHPENLEELEYCKYYIDEQVENIESDFIKDSLDLSDIDWDYLSDFS